MFPGSAESWGQFPDLAHLAAPPLPPKVSKLVNPPHSSMINNTYQISSASWEFDMLKWNFDQLVYNERMRKLNMVNVNEAITQNDQKHFLY